jgi:hypothetical protein
LALLVAAGLAGGANGARVHLSKGFQFNSFIRTSQHLPAVAISVRAH